MNRGYNILWFRVLVVMLLVFILIGVYNEREEVFLPLPPHDSDECYREIIEDSHNLRAVKEQLGIGEGNNENPHK